MPTQLIKLAITNPATLSETLTFSVFQEGAEEASRQVISIEPNEAVIENNRLIHTSKVYNITISGMYSQAAQTQLHTWSQAGTELWFTGFGLDGHILQAQGTLQPNLGTEDNLSFRFSSQREAVGGYDDTGYHSSGMSYSKNGLALHKWQEGSTTGIASGWSKSGGVTSWSSGVQSFSTSGSTDVFFQRDIYFPFPNKAVRFSIDLQSGATVTGSASVQILAYNSSGTAIGTTSSEALGGTGRNSVQRTLPAGTEYIRVRVQINDANIDFIEPVLGLGGYETFVEFLT